MHYVLVSLLSSFFSLTVDIAYFCVEYEVVFRIYLIRNQALKEGREPDFSEYKQFKLTCENVGFQMLEKMGWKEGEGLGIDGQGIVNPVNK